MFKLLVLLVAVASVFGDNFFYTGDCPVGRSVGERWTVNGQCIECYCDLNGWGCSGCDVLTPVIGCYKVVNNTATYPDCCPRLKCLTLNNLIG